MNVGGQCVSGTFSPAAAAIAKWVVVSPHGRKLPYRGPDAKIKYRELVRCLDRGKSLTAIADLTPALGELLYFDFSVPGTYQMRLDWSMFRNG